MLLQANEITEIGNTVFHLLHRGVATAIRYKRGRNDIGSQELFHSCSNMSPIYFEVWHGI